MQWFINVGIETGFFLRTSCPAGVIQRSTIENICIDTDKTTRSLMLDTFINIFPVGVYLLHYNSNCGDATLIDLKRIMFIKGECHELISRSAALAGDICI